MANKKKASPLFGILNSIQSKEYTWEELPEDYVLNYNQFMINRFLSSYEYLLELLSVLSTQKLTNEQHYKILYNWVKKTKHYFNYDSYKIDESVDKDLIRSIELEYDISTKDAKYINTLLTNEQRKYIKKAWHDYLKYDN